MNKIKLSPLRLNKFFYPIGILEKTAEEFEGLADIEIESDETHHSIFFCVKQDVNPELLKKEFANYCLLLGKKEINTAAFRTL